MRKLVIIGIDGMDFDLYDKWKDELPNLRKLQTQGLGKPLESVYPPDSICAWTTIFTGLDPSEHGLLYTINYLNNNADIQIDNSAFKGKTFWDKLSVQDKRVCIVNPFLAYPPWKVNGSMISGPVFIDGTNKSYPDEIKYEYTLPEMGGIIDFPTEKSILQFYERTVKSTNDLTNFGLEILKKEPWDLFFITFLTLDRIKHFLWRYQDENDPTYPGLNNLNNSIKNFYILFDKIIGHFEASISSDTNLIVISDHGHQRRCYRIINLNEFLRIKGFLIPSIRSNKIINKYYLIEKLKSLVLKSISKFKIEDFASKLIKYIPYKNELKKSTFSIDFDESFAFLDIEFSGKNPSCGIRVNKKLIEEKGMDYELVRNNIIIDISELTDSETNKKVVKWIKKREEVYSGKYIDRFPDILVELNENYGVDFSLYDKLIVNSVTHRKISGGHRTYGVLFSKNKLEINKTQFNLLDISPVILSHFA